MVGNPTKTEETALMSAMPAIPGDQTMRIEERKLCLGKRNTVLALFLFIFRRVPFKQCHHSGILAIIWRLNHTVIWSFRPTTRISRNPADVAFGLSACDRSG